METYTKFPERWEANSVINLIHLLTPNSLTLIIDCGIDDFFYEENKQLHDRLSSPNISHDFISKPGGHTWDYWNNAVGY